MDMEKAMIERHSIRKYGEKAVEGNIFDKINEYIENAETLYSKIQYRIEVVREPEKVRELKIGFMGGKISINAPCCMIAITEKVQGCYENIGFIQEQIVLKMTQLGIGTCWLGTFDRDAIGKKYHVKENESIANVIAFGYLQKSFYNNGLRKLLGTTKRKEVDEIVYYKKWNEKSNLFLEDNQDICKILKRSTTAPSADNGQPVRIVADESNLHIFSMNQKNKYCKIDAGIFISHIILLLREYNISYSDVEKNTSINDVSNASYILSIKYKK